MTAPGKRWGKWNDCCSVDTNGDSKANIYIVMNREYFTGVQISITAATGKPKKCSRFATIIQYKECWFLETTVNISSVSDFVK